MKPLSRSQVATADGSDTNSVLMLPQNVIPPWRLVQKVAVGLSSGSESVSGPYKTSSSNQPSGTAASELDVQPSLVRQGMKILLPIT
jgi:hypothetical protein